MRLDNRAQPPGPINAHFVFRIGGKTVVYCRIRKNGCSVMEKFIMGISPHNGKRPKGSLPFIRKYHAVRAPKVLRGADHKLLILRDPVERIQSTFNNKFVQKSGASDIFNNYQKLTGNRPEQATIRDFVFNYLDKLYQQPLDPHVWPQNWHVCNIVYDKVIFLRDLHAGMADIAGSELANEYFEEKLNASDREDTVIEPDIRQKILELYAEDVELLQRVG